MQPQQPFRSVSKPVRQQQKSPLERPQADPDKLVLVKITLKKESGEPNPVMLTDLTLRTEDTGLNIDWEVLTKANDMLGGRYTGVALNPGDQCEAVLPYGLWEKRFKARTWRSLDEMELYLKVTKGLTAKEVQVNG